MKQASQVDPKGRVDLLLLNIAQVVTGRLEQTIQERVGKPIQLWQHVEPLVRAEIKRRKIPERSLDAQEVVALVLGKRVRRLKCTV